MQTDMQTYPRTPARLPPSSPILLSMTVTPAIVRQIFCFNIVPFSSKEQENDYHAEDRLSMPSSKTSITRLFARRTLDAFRLAGIRALNRKQTERAVTFVFCIIAGYEVLVSRWNSDTEDDDSGGSAVEETGSASGHSFETYRRRLIDVGRRFANSILHSRIGTLFLENAVLLRTTAADATQSIILQTRESASRALTAGFNRQLDKIMDTIAERVADEIKDKDMPGFVLRTIDETMATVIPDVKREMFRQTSKVREIYLSPGAPRRKSISRHNYDVPTSPLLPQTPIGGQRFDRLIEDASESDSQRPSGRCSGMRKSTITARNYMLYTLFPFDKSIWTQMRNINWWMLTAPAFVPVVAEVWWVFLFFVRNLDNEFQLIDFIVSFQNAKFLTSGILGTLRGATLYFFCVTRENMLCSVDGPMMDPLAALLFCVQICLTWVAFLRLPKVHRPRTSYEGLLAIRRGSAVAVNGSDYPISEENDRTLDPGSLATVPRGGHLSKWFWYDTTITLISIALMGVAFGSNDGDFSSSWRLRSTFYWVRTVYGLLSFPFFILKLPLMMKVLTHATKTGYDQNGRIVFAVRKT